jgi:hypothetical protein
MTPVADAVQVVASEILRGGTLYAGAVGASEGLLTVGNDDATDQAKDGVRDTRTGRWVWFTDRTAFGIAHAFVRLVGPETAHAAALKSSNERARFEETIMGW